MNSIEAQKILAPEFHSLSNTLSDLMKAGLEYVTSASVALGVAKKDDEEIDEELVKQIDRVARHMHNAALMGILAGVRLGKKMAEMEESGTASNETSKEAEEAAKAAEALIASFTKKHD